MSFATSGQIGIDLSRTSSDPLFTLGLRVAGDDNSVWVYVKASAAIAANDVVTFDETFSTTVAPISTSNDARGDLVGVAPVAFSDDDYGWLQVAGPCKMNVKASAAANTLLNTTATAGSLDDDATAGAYTVQGAYLTAANSGTAGATAAMLNHPFVDAVVA